MTLRLELSERERRMLLRLARAAMHRSQRPAIWPG